ncbi:hypothetical protein BIU88_07725 [Chlorobaculum limnaeum]|uniref:CARDB domain-containing protein n=1 Tax=Chlorobaculum limnaeum TaxID=274537 RepID=A0A1D8D4D5_CHLLM|nr:hypothetical protein [Chlorobaculum limnaeum]AOS84037.1 hypothetical protein BIU88_07725 [Chlorobaculum limnaeum]
MKSSRLFVLALSCGIAFLPFNDAAQARVMYEPIQNKAPLKIYQYPKVKLCPDLSATLTVTKSDQGRVTIDGTVTNTGKARSKTASVAEVIMNLSYAPQYSYAKTGVSDILVSRSFNDLKAGDSIQVRAVYQIPDFGGWTSATVQGNAKRLFTLRVIRQDSAPYKPDEECDIENNVAEIIVFYRDLNH